MPCRSTQLATIFSRPQHKQDPLPNQIDCFKFTLAFAVCQLDTRLSPTMSQFQTQYSSSHEPHPQFTGPLSTRTQLRNMANAQTNRPERLQHLMSTMQTPDGQVSAGQSRDRNSDYWSQVAASANAGSDASQPVHSLIRRNRNRGRFGRQRRSAVATMQHPRTAMEQNMSASTSSADSVQHGQYVNTTVNRATHSATELPATASSKSSLPVRKRSFLGDASTRLKGVVYDLGNWKDLPVKGGIGAKIKYVFGRDKRPWSLMSVLGCLLFVGLVILAIYFISKAVGKSSTTRDLQGGGDAAAAALASGSAMPSATSAPVSMDFEMSEQMINRFAGGNGVDADMVSGEFPFIDFQ